MALYGNSALSILSQITHQQLCWRSIVFTTSTKPSYSLAHSTAKIQTKLFKTSLKCHNMPWANKPIHSQYSVSGTFNSCNIRQEKKINIFDLLRNLNRVWLTGIWRKTSCKQIPQSSVRRNFFPCSLKHNFSLLQLKTLLIFTWKIQRENKWFKWLLKGWRSFHMMLSSWRCKSSVWIQDIYINRSCVAATCSLGHITWRLISRQILADRYLSHRNSHCHQLSVTDIWCHGD